MKYNSIRFNNKIRKDFFTDVKEQVDLYFESNNLSKHANTAMIIKTITLFTIYFGSWGLILSGLFPIWGMFALAILMGFGKAGIGFSIAHDAIHGAYSSNKTVNKILGFSMNLIGGSAYVWNITHNKVHHTYTNIHSVDEDLEVTSLMRMSPEAPYKKVHRFQHIYFPIVYSLATIFWVFGKDYKKVSQKNIGPYKVSLTTADKLELFGFKAFYYLYTIIIPLLVLDVALWQFLIGFVAMHLTAGITLGIIFQLAHVVEETEHPMPDTDGKIDNAWAVHQMETTANFARTNRFINWYVGGLNFQVEHHLFPNICSIHYPTLSNIVKRVAEKHGVPYNEHPTFFGAVRSHINMLYKLGHMQPIQVKRPEKTMAA